MKSITITTGAVAVVSFFGALFSTIIPVDGLTSGLTVTFLVSSALFSLLDKQTGYTASAPALN